MEKSSDTKKRSPWAWIPTLYFAQGLPYVAVMTISVIMYKRLGISNTDIALYTSWLYLPWVIKPFWSPFIDMFKTKRWWTISMQWIIAFALAGIAFTIPTPFFFQLTLAVFWIMGFTSATHDIAADGFYMHALTEHEQSMYVGIRSTFYRVATVAGQGLLVILAGLIELNTGLAPANVNLVVAPDYSNEIVLPQFASAPKSGEMAFEFSSDSIMVGVSADAAHKAAIDSVKTLAFLLNEENGFTAAETKPDASQNKVVVDDVPAESAFTAWVRDTFGQKREAVATSDKTENIAVVAVRLNQKPADDDSKVLITSYKNGDQSIKLDDKSSRLVFTAQNWDKPAYLVFHIDPKIKSLTNASFEGTSGNISFAWVIVFVVLSAFFFAVSIYHSWALPKPKSDHAAKDVTPKTILKEFGETWATFFTRKSVGQTIAAIAFMLLYRLPEAQLVKLINPFLLDPVDKGGLGLTTGEVGLVYGTIGIIGLTIGGIIGGIVAAKGGLKKWLLPMAWSMSLTCLTFVYLSYFQTHSLLIINICVFIEQFGYGFGFTAYMLYLIYFSEGEHKTAHYAICTGFMALGMMLPGMAAGWLQETIGYQHFFVWTMICCIATILVCMIIKVDPKFGLKEDSKE